MSSRTIEAYPPGPDEFPRKASSGSGSMKGYSVEARYAYPSAKMIVGNLLDARWSTVQFVETVPPFGVPIGRRYNDPWLRNTGLYGFQAAQALRWWFLAAAEAECSVLCIETRLVEHEITYSYSSTATRPVEGIGGDDRSHIMPKRDEPPPIPQAAKVA